MIQYALSKRQLTFIESGEGLRLALPETSWCPYDGTKDELIRWVLDSVPELSSDQISDVTRCQVSCHLLNRGGAPGSIACHVGEIVDEDNVDNLPCYFLRAIVVVIGQGMRLTRWPGGAVTYVRADR